MGRYEDFREPKRRSHGDEDTQIEWIAAPTSTPERRASKSQVVGETRDCVGTVKFYNADKSFGFVGPDEGRKDVFVHAFALERAGISILAEGQRVRLQIGKGKKRLEAKAIELLG